MNRRTMLRASGAAALGGAVVGLRALAGPAAGATSAMFAHGVASGDPLPDGILLWTRVTPSPDATPGSGLGPAVTVRWQLATDPSFAEPVSAGEVRTGPDRDHTVSVEVTGLAAASVYYYRFLVDTATSPVGLTRTAPADDATPDRLRFGVVSCSNWEAGYFAAYRYLGERGDLDAVVHLGDYVYEYRSGEYTARGELVRPNEQAAEPLTLADYRRRHAQYKTDPDLQALHAAVPWIITWDDHETADNSWSGGARNHDPATEGDFTARRAAAWQAYREWMPVRTGPDRLYRRLRFGTLAELSMLDLRRYRSEQVEPTGGLGAVDDPQRTIAGDEQLDWLVSGLVGSTAQWKLVGTSVMISPLQIPPLPAELAGPLAELLGVPRGGVPYSTDQWDGYTADRRTVLRALHAAGVRDTVFLTGDIHSSWAAEVPLDAGSYPLSPPVATELVCTSVTSDNIDDILMAPPRTASLAVEAAIVGANRHIKFVEVDSHGAAVLDVTPHQVQMDWYYLADRTVQGSDVRHAHSYRVPAGTQRVRPAPTPVR